LEKSFKNMSRIVSLFFVVGVFVGCNSPKNEDSIAFVCLYPNILYDTMGNPYLHIKQYAEYKFSNKDSLFIGVSGNDYYDINNENTLQFGLEKFCASKIDNDFSELMVKILNGEYKESYKKEVGEYYINDGRTSIVVINRNGKQKFILCYEKELLPDELEKADNLINQIIFGYTNFSMPMLDKPNYSRKLILSLQDSLFQKHPPELPLNSIKFTPPMINENR